MYSALPKVKAVQNMSVNPARVGTQSMRLAWLACALTRPARAVASPLQLMLARPIGPFLAIPALAPPVSEVSVYMPFAKLYIKNAQPLEMEANSSKNQGGDANDDACVRH